MVVRGDGEVNGRHGLVCAKGTCTPSVRLLQRGIRSFAIKPSSPRTKPSSVSSSSWNTASSTGALVAPPIFNNGPRCPCSALLPRLSECLHHVQNPQTTTTFISERWPAKYPSPYTEKARYERLHGNLDSLGELNALRAEVRLFTRLFKCCLALYESLVEKIVWIFIPFYDELKSVVLIFLILSRARVCIPINDLGSLVTSFPRVPNPFTSMSFDLFSNLTCRPSTLSSALSTTSGTSCS
jgi:hypothetical protein